MVDPIAAAIESAVERAVAAQIPKIIEAISSKMPPSAPMPVQGDRLLRMAEVVERLGVHRSTVSRLEKLGKLPPRRRVGSAVGYLESDLRAIVGQDAEPKRKRKAS